jgi:mannose-6-phosphate isomerase-like protein (cupin superfamily)
VGDVEAADFPWGRIKWLMNAKLDAEAEQTFGLVFINPGDTNDLHVHPNCEELLFVASGQCDHRLGEDVFPMREGELIRIPAGVAHNATNTGWEPVRMVVAYSSGERRTEVLPAEEPCSARTS